MPIIGVIHLPERSKCIFSIKTVIHYMQVCKPNAGLNIIMYLIKGQPGDLGEKKEKRKSVQGHVKVYQLPGKLGVYVQAGILRGPLQPACCSRCVLCL